jgi:hypothetical protein
MATSIGITHTNKGRNPDGDNLINLRGTEKGPVSNKELSAFMKDPKSAIFHVTAFDTYPCNVLRYKKNFLIFPEPNPVAFYYSLVNGSTVTLQYVHKDLVTYYKNKESPDPRVRSEIVLFSYIFKHASTGIIFAFSAIEALLNQLIPDNYSAVRKGKNITKERIQYYYAFEEKLLKLIPSITGKDYFKKYPKRKNIFLNLKSLRNDLIHLKNNSKTDRTYYTNIYQEMLDADIGKIQRSIKHLINFYQPGLIRERRK